jgi:hypothetical protein
LRLFSGRSGDAANAQAGRGSHAISEDVVNFQCFGGPRIGCWMAERSPTLRPRTWKAAKKSQKKAASMGGCKF